MNVWQKRIRGLQAVRLIVCLRVHAGVYHFANAAVATLEIERPAACSRQLSRSIQ